MDDISFAKIKKELNDAINDVSIAGLKGMQLHSFLRAAITNLHFKWIQKKESRTDDIFKKLSDDVKSHLVAKVEKEEYQAVHMIVMDHVYLYLTLRSILLYFEKNLEDTDKMIKAFTNLCEKKGVPKDQVEEITKILNKTVDRWMEGITGFRANINSVWNSARGTFGSNMAIGLTLFEKMHTEGYFTRRKERSTFKEWIKDEYELYNITSRLKHAQKKEDLEKMLRDIEQKTTEMANDFNIFTKLLFATWNRVNENMHKLVKVVADAASVHELPAKDSEQMKELLELINTKVNERHLHSLRISDKQLEALLEKAKEGISRVRKAAVYNTVG